MKRKTQIFAALFFIAGLFTMPLTAHANGCTDICQGNAGCTGNCLKVITNMVANIDGQVCKAYMQKSGQESMAISCRSILESVLGRMVK